MDGGRLTFAFEPNASTHVARQGEAVRLLVLVSPLRKPERCLRMGRVSSDMALPPIALTLLCEGSPRFAEDGSAVSMEASLKKPLVEVSTSACVCVCVQTTKNMIIGIRPVVAKHIGIAIVRQILRHRHRGWETPQTVAVEARVLRPIAAFLVFSRAVEGDSRPRAQTGARRCAQCRARLL